MRRLSICMLVWAMFYLKVSLLYKLLKQFIQKKGVFPYTPDIYKDLASTLTVPKGMVIEDILPVISRPLDGETVRFIDLT